MSNDSSNSPPELPFVPVEFMISTAIGILNEHLGDDLTYKRLLRSGRRFANFILPQHPSNRGIGGIDSHNWFPPEPEDIEPSNNISSFDQGKFKALVEHLLKSVGVYCSGNDGDNWVEIVTSLSCEAASFLDPDAFEGKTMDPDGYVKVKCIATGTPSQSEVFKGLVFKTHATHNHMMPTKFIKPKLLLIKDNALSVSSDGLSSFELMKLEADKVNNITRMNPNVVLVEKTVSGDTQESIYSIGMTLVLEMKKDRLERVACYTESPILSSRNLNYQNLKQCESFYIERIVEEHANLCVSGQKPEKTLMFLEGSPTRMGFTILLKGCHSDELKKVKRVVQIAVIMAYHLIRESSFVLNQQAMFSTSAPDGMTIYSNENVEMISSTSTQPLYTNLDDTNVPLLNESSLETKLITTVDIPISNHFDENGLDNLGLEGSALSSYEQYDSIILSSQSSLSASLQEVVGFPPFDTMGFNDVNAHMHNHNESNDQDLNHNESSGQDLCSTENVETTEVKVESNETTSENFEDGIQSKDEIRAVLDSESILVLTLSRNVTLRTTCKQSSFSRIKFYKNFDIPLGKFLQDKLLNQKHLCATCNETQEAHLHYYAHHSKQLTIQVKRIPSGKHLIGENEGQIWMWSCCGQCEPSNGSLKSTKRVLLSIAARALSFGKFLKLGFSNDTSCEIASSCGHSYNKDYLHFFGLGSIAAMFRFEYSTSATYSVSLPQWKVEFSNSMEGNYLSEEVENVFQEGHLMFQEVDNSLEKMENEFSGSMLKLQGTCKTFSDIKELLTQERNQFQVDMEILTTNSSRYVYVNKWLQKPLYLNYMRWELFLYSYIWDQRLFSIVSSDHTTIGPQTTDESVENDNTDFVQVDIEAVPNDLSHVKLETTEESTSTSIPCEMITTETEIEIESSITSQKNGFQENGEFLTDVADPKGWMWTPFSQIQNIHFRDCQKEYLPIYEPINSYTSGSTIYKIITEHGSKLHFPLATNNHMLSLYEDELSSMIACALAYLNDGKISSEDIKDDTKMPSVSSPIWSSFTFTNSDSSSLESSLEESSCSSAERLKILDSNPRDNHPVVFMGRYDKKAKYSVACLFAREFLDLRGQCGLSELDYISSLSRCKKWDAKGGKSKSFFAKTFDDRFIIKEIKSIEFYSFRGFASKYFGYMTECYTQGNQTCLAKILGIYQVIKLELMSHERAVHARKP